MADNNQLNLKIISAGAGSGKTYRLTEEMVDLLEKGVRAQGIIATTFTSKAASELQERVRVRLLEKGLVDKANDLTNALIGTVHGLGVKLLKRFAFLAGVSPEVAIIADEDQQTLFNQSLSTVLRVERIKQMEDYSTKLGLSNDNKYYDWRNDIKYLTDAARANDFSIQILEESKQKSIESLLSYLGKRSKKSSQEWIDEMKTLLETTVDTLTNNPDQTKTTATVIDVLGTLKRKIELDKPLTWGEWVKISKLKPGTKSRDDFQELKDFALTHDTHPAFHDDITNYLTTIFDIAIEAINEYEAYKKQRGLIDYIDMEIQVNRLLDHPEVKNILAAELDLLMVDEFQDTSPIQLEIFLKLSKIANHSIWVGDPKQSIYGFRGAEPRLMLAIIEANGGIKEEDIQKYSWRSREDIVNLTNAIFTKSFKDLPKERVALEAKRTKQDNPNDPNFKKEPTVLQDALMQWHFEIVSDDGKKKRTNKQWFSSAIANQIRITLERNIQLEDRHNRQIRSLEPGDIAILCRTNGECIEMAEALHQAGLKAAIARTGLLETAEAKLVMACLKYMLHRSDSLSVAEILLLNGEMPLNEIITNRLDWLKTESPQPTYWANDRNIIQQLNFLRSKANELSSTEILNLLLESLDLRRTIARWGNINQRMENIDIFRKFALQYEENCNRLHSAASLGGFLLYLNNLYAEGKDTRGSGEGKDAINILTYHRSKGLEWPLVICHSLEKNMRDSLWGINIVAESDQVDLNNILGNRWLRYWINPYGRQIQGTGLAERIADSDIQKIAKQQALEEEARLLYVGITRARDYLVFPTREGASPKWLNRSYHEGQDDHPTLDHQSSESIWSWNSQPLVIQPEVCVCPKDFPRLHAKEDSLSYLEKRASKEEYLPYFLDHSSFLKQNKHLSVSAKKFQALGTSFMHKPKHELKTIGRIIAGYTSSDDLHREEQLRLEMAQNLLDIYDANDIMEAEELCLYSNQFHQYLQDNYQPEQVFKNYPITMNVQQQVFKTNIDFLLVNEHSATIIQQSHFGGLENKYQQHLKKEWFGWLALAEMSIEKIFNKPNTNLLVHFTIGNGFFPLKISKASQ